MNVGATSETDTGLYFAWGDTLGYTVNQFEFNAEDYIFYDPDSNEYTKYNSTDNLYSLLPADDAITQSWGGKWQIPSDILLKELFLNTQQDYVSNYNNTGIPGFILTGLNENTIFLPTSGYILNGISYNTDYFNTWVRTAESSMRTAEYYNMYNVDGVYYGQGLMERFSGMVIRGAIGNEVLTVNGYLNGSNFSEFSEYLNALNYDLTYDTYNLTLVLKEPINATEASFLTRTYNSGTHEYNPWINYSVSSSNEGLTWTTQIPAVYADLMQLTLDNKSFMVVVITNIGK